MTEPHEVLSPDELASEQAAEDAEIGDDEPDEAPDPSEDDDTIVELADDDEFEEMKIEAEGEEAG
jgi:hypothetical protein